MRFVQWLDTRAVRLPGVRSRTDDTVAQLRSTLDPHWHGALPIEYEGELDRDGLDRWQEYIALQRRGLRWGPRALGKFDVMLALVQLTGRRPAAKLRMRIPGVPGIGSELDVRVRALAEEDAAATLRGIREGTIATCILVWVPLMRGPETGLS